MARYYDVFIQNGVDDMEIVYELSESHLKDMSVPIGHRLKIMKKVREVMI